MAYNSGTTDRLSAQGYLGGSASTYQNYGSKVLGHDYTSGGGGGGGQTVVYVGGGSPDYSSNIGATLGTARMGVPTLITGYQDTWNNLAQDKDAADQLYNENLQLAEDTYNQNMRQQLMQNEDYWYQHRQKKQNWEALNATQVGTGMYGSLDKSTRKLSNTEEDIFNQNLLATLRAGKQNAKQNFMDNYNSIMNNKKQNDIDFDAQKRNLETQYKNAAAEYATNIFNQLGNYGASKYIDKNGNVTGAGLAFINELNERGFGVQSDGRGSWTVDPSIIFEGNPGAMDIYNRLSNDKNAPFMTADFDGFRRSLEETNKTMQDRSATINKAKSNKTLTAPEYWAKYSQQYG